MINPLSLTKQNVSFKPIKLPASNIEECLIVMELDNDFETQKSINHKIKVDTLDCTHITIFKS